MLRRWPVIAVLVLIACAVLAQTVHQYFEGDVVVAGDIKKPDGTTVLFDAPGDSLIYARSNHTWVAVAGLTNAGGIAEAPGDGKGYVRRNSGWEQSAWSFLTGTPTTLSGYGITDAASDSELAAHSALISGVHGISSFASTLLDDTSASAARSTLGLGNSATLNVGTNAGTVAAGNHTHTEFDAAGTAAAAVAAHEALPDPHAQYQTQAEGDARYLRLTGGNVTGTLAISNSAPALRLYETDVASNRHVHEIAGDNGDLVILAHNDSGSSTTEIVRFRRSGMQITNAAFGVSQITRGGQIVWDSGTDGAGSGLDADLLDGLQGSHYLAWSNFTGKPTTLAGYGITDGASDSELAAHSALTSGVHGISSWAATLLDDTSASAARSTLGLGSAATNATADFASASHSHAASAITSGVIATARLGTGTANSGTFLRGDGTWSAVPGGLGEAPVDGRTYARSNSAWVVPSFTALTNRPTTLAGYGITDAASDAELAAHVAHANPHPVYYRTGTGMHASNITAGVIAPARLGTGTPGTGNFLRGDGAWASVPGGGDMLKSVYDVNGDGIVEQAGLASGVPWSGVSGRPITLEGYGIIDAASDLELAEHSYQISGVHGISSWGAQLIDDTDAAAGRLTLGLGTAATANIGTTAGTVASGTHNHAGVYMQSAAGISINRAAPTYGITINADVAASGWARYFSLGNTNAGAWAHGYFGSYGTGENLNYAMIGVLSGQPSQVSGSTDHLDAQFRFYPDSFRPRVSGTYDLGASGQSWSRVYASQGIFSDIVSVGGNTVWHTGNDGAGSGLDADLLDSHTGAYYLNRTNHTGTQPWTTISATPTTLAGYGITDAAPLSHVSQTVGAHGMTAFGASLVNDNTAADARGTLGLGPAAIASIGPLPGQVAAGDHNHDSRYYTESEVNSFLAGKANIGHSHSGSDITSGTISPARLGTGTANSGTYLRGDGTWAAIPGGLGDAPADGLAYLRKSSAWVRPGFADLSTHPSTLAGYGITDAASDSDLSAHSSFSWGVHGITAFGASLTTSGDAADARAALGLGDSATRSVGTSAGTVAAGDDSRFLSATQKTDLTDGGDSTSHFHSSDRARANHTGTQDIVSTTTGTLPVSRGGTGATDAATARANLGAQAADPDLDALASAGSVGTGAFVRESAAGGGSSGPSVIGWKHYTVSAGRLGSQISAGGSVSFSISDAADTHQFIVTIPASAGNYSIRASCRPVASEFGMALIPIINRLSDSGSNHQYHIWFNDLLGGGGPGIAVGAVEAVLVEILK